MHGIRWSNVMFAVAYVALIVGVFLALGGPAYAAGQPTSASDQYGTSASDQYGTSVAGVTISESTGQAASGTGAEALPNTGLSLGVTALVGFALIAAGFALRRRERRAR